MFERNTDVYSARKLVGNEECFAQEHCVIIVNGEQITVMIPKVMM